MYIQKSSGEQELFSLEKFTKSLAKAGAHAPLIDEITRIVQEQMATITNTKQLYSIALNYLQDKNPVVACRYNLKEALFLLGPTGFPFEQFVARIFLHQGFDTATGQILQGNCVEHEVDVLATRGNQRIFVECKFRQTGGLKIDLTVPMYIKARFDDLVARAGAANKGTHYEAWVVTNVKFTSEAIRYAQCAGIRLLGWSYPVDNNMQILIDQMGLHPITASPYLSKKQKQYLVQHGLVFCHDAAQYKALLAECGLTPRKIEQFIKACHGVCRME